ncbi:hypothetical protein FRB94_003767 [Tulasnella sp. JGI-2019a]|nr:hypothetical protein FRB94_003767 [Tulasnella sp. JGI-2019a]KAG9031556.1 hypothetical protein FRB95_002550 [Tulasnella sp. JGI-2019a]
MPHTSRPLEPGNSSAFLRPPEFELPIGRIEPSLSSESYTGRLPPIDPRRTAANSVSLPTVAEILQSQSFASEESVLNTISYKPVTPTQQNRDVIKAGRVFYAIAMDIASFTPTVWRAEASFGVSHYEGFLVIRTGMGDKFRFFAYCELDYSVGYPRVIQAPESSVSAGPSALAELAQLFLLDAREESSKISTGIGPSPLLRVIYPQFTVAEGVKWAISWRLAPGMSIAVKQRLALAKAQAADQPRH